MAKATITITDIPDGAINIHAEFYLLREMNSSPDVQILNETVSGDDDAQSR